jgi:GT2 family glycosyltransferase
VSSQARASVEPLVSVVVLAFGEEPLLGRCVEAALASEGARVEVVVVDNGCLGDAVARLPDSPAVEVIRPGENTGFAGGCNLAARRSRGEVVALVNSDALLEPAALAALARTLEDEDVGIATGSLRLLDRPGVMNSAGNPVHFLGLSWAGGLGEPASSHLDARAVASASGAVMALRRETWEALGGFFEPMFAYCEDMELSLRCWLSGREVRYVPDAVALHAYEFHRNPRKLYLLERNRLMVVLTLYGGRLLWLVAGPLVALELAVLLVALKQGWARQKLAGWWWLVRHASLVRRRRHAVQLARRRPDAVLAALLTGAFEPGVETGFAVPPSLARMSELYWRLARRWIR